LALDSWDVDYEPKEKDKEKLVAFVGSDKATNFQGDRNPAKTFKKLWFLVGPKGPHTCGIS
jgi:hypothetical protein